jgi:2-polyprenyl-3-methyl-5-hydroxy-6-metoxy-1,4-benzoquinol methylase
VSAPKEKLPPVCSVIQRAVVRRLRALGLSPGTKLLDAPCGDGALALTLNESGFECWGADVETQASKWLGDRFQVTDLNGPLPWPDASFSLVVCVEGIEHLENRFAFLREAYRILHDGGYLLLTTPNIVSLRSRVRYLGSAFFHRDPRPLSEARRHPLHHIGLLSYPQLRYTLHTSGFTIQEVGHTHSKPISYLYAPYIPWMWLYTRIAFRKEKDPAQRRRNREIRKALFSPSLLFGENVMVITKKV